MKAKKQFLAQCLPMQEKMQRMAESLLHDEELAEDVVQDCFVSLWNMRRKIKDVKNIEAWCITLVRNRCIDVLRRETRVGETEGDGVADEHDERDDYEERLERAMELIEQLPERQREVVRLRHFEDKSTEEIAATMGVSEGNVYTMLSRAYKTLKQKIKEYEQRERTAGA